MLAAVVLSASETVRIDKWLWCVRVFKTRAAATAACRAGTVLIDAAPVKAARELRVGELVLVRQGLITRSLRYLGPPPSRVAAKRVPEFCADLTPPEELAKARREPVQQFLARERGAGRPTKRDRRQLAHLLGRA